MTFDDKARDKLDHLATKLAQRNRLIRDIADIIDSHPDFADKLFSPNMERRIRAMVKEIEGGNL